MSKKVVFKNIFRKQFDKLSNKDQILVSKALEALDLFFNTGQRPYGLRPKKLYGNSKVKTYEARVSLQLRIVWVESREGMVFSLIGNHDEVCLFLGNL